MKKTPNEFHDNVCRFHNENLYIPTRTIYFGGSNDVEDEINSVSCASLIKNFQILEHKEVAPISLVLNSCGGSWEDGIAVYDLIKTLKSTVNIIGMGKLYSMGSVLFQAGDARYVLPNTTMMIHDGSEGYVGIPKSYESWAVWSKLTREKMYKIYYDKMNKKNKKITLKKIEDMCSKDTIFNANEMVSLGLADKTIKYIK
jgi:ATP-dependent Clp protease protease subunit